MHMRKQIALYPSISLADIIGPKKSNRGIEKGMGRKWKIGTVWVQKTRRKQMKKAVRVTCDDTVRGVRPIDKRALY